MHYNIRIAAFVLLAVSATAAFAQAGADTYKTKCASCHGSVGMADTAAAKTMKVKPISDPEVSKMTEEQMIAATKNGVINRMKPYKDTLSDAEIKDAIKYFRSFMK